MNIWILYGAWTIETAQTSKSRFWDNQKKRFWPKNSVYVYHLLIYYKNIQIFGHIYVKFVILIIVNLLNLELLINLIVICIRVSGYLNYLFLKLFIINFNLMNYFIVKIVYFISNLINLDSKLCQFQENNSNR